MQITRSRNAVCNCLTCCLTEFLSSITAGEYKEENIIKKQHQIFEITSASSETYLFVEDVWSQWQVVWSLGLLEKG